MKSGVVSGRMLTWDVHSCSEVPGSALLATNMAAKKCRWPAVWAPARCAPPARCGLPLERRLGRPPGWRWETLHSHGLYN